MPCSADVTMADIANSNAEDARRENAELARRLAQLERRLGVGDTDEINLMTRLLCQSNRILDDIRDFQPLPNETAASYRRRVMTAVEDCWMSPELKTWRRRHQESDQRRAAYAEQDVKALLHRLGYDLVSVKFQ